MPKPIVSEMLQISLSKAIFLSRLNLNIQKALKRLVNGLSHFVWSHLSLWNVEAFCNLGGCLESGFILEWSKQHFGKKVKAVGTGFLSMKSDFTFPILFYSSMLIAKWWLNHVPKGLPILIGFNFHKSASSKKWWSSNAQMKPNY